MSYKAVLLHPLSKGRLAAHPRRKKSEKKLAKNLVV